jgi:heme exporter protein B
MIDFLILLHHDMRFHARQMAEWAALVLFFFIIILLLPFVVGPEPELLRRLAPGLIWLAVLLMSLLALDKLFIQDACDGTLDLMLLSPVAMPLIVFSKLLAQTLTMLVALAFLMLPACLMLNMDLNLLPVLAYTLLLGVPVLVFLGGMLAAVTLGLQRNAALLTLLLVPFYVPVLIFATAACDAATLGMSAASPLFLLASMLALLLPAAPFIIAVALRNSQS